MLSQSVPPIYIYLQRRVPQEASGGRHGRGTQPEARGKRGHMHGAWMHGACKQAGLLGAGRLRLGDGWIEHPESFAGEMRWSMLNVRARDRE
jgi:hypothetical protein